MTMAEIQPVQALKTETDMGELKRPLQHEPVEEKISEWERARMTSKTWSMEQD